MMDLIERELAYLHGLKRGGLGTVSVTYTKELLEKLSLEIIRLRGTLLNLEVDARDHMDSGTSLSPSRVLTVIENSLEKTK